MCEKRKKLLRVSRMNLLFLIDSTLGFALLACLDLGSSLFVLPVLTKLCWVLLFNGACQGFHHSRALKRSDNKSMPVGGISF